MIYEVRVTTKNKIDPKGHDLLAEIKRTLRITSVKEIKTAKVYRLEGINLSQVELLTSTLLAETQNQQAKIDKPVFNKGQIVEIAYKPGVMNPEAASILKSARDLGINLKAADSSWEYAFFPKLEKQILQKILNRLLVNKTVEKVITSKPKTLMITGSPKEVKTIRIRNLSDVELIKLSKDSLFLNLEEMKIIQNYFKKIRRDPTDCEIEILAQTWSEHCVHKTFRASLTIDGKKKEPLFSRIKKTAAFNKKIIVSAFDDNSGVIDFYDGFGISGKVETHNSPSAIEPYGGAMTGSGGVFRDILGTGKGAKPIASTDIFCFAPPSLPEKELPPGCLPPDYLLRKVVAGVRDYGNRVGIPTNNGSIHFHKDFRAKPTVAVGSFGIIPKKYAQKGTIKINDLIVTVGGKTGRDGIHGATFSSGEMTSKTITVSGSSVQIGNAIEEKRVIDLVLAARDKNLIRAITDCGAGGFSSAIGEMAKNIGAKVYLEKAPLKYPGLSPWEIFLSESQERMIIAVSPKNFKKLMELAKLYNVEAAVMGDFDGSKKLQIFYKKQSVANLDMKFLHDGLPQRKMAGTYFKRQIKNNLPQQSANLDKAWKKVMAHFNVASKEPIVRLYDHNVQGTSALHPFSGVEQDGPNDGTILRPIYQKPYGVVITHGLNPVLNSIDPYWGSLWAITEAVANYVSIGGDLKSAALVDNFIWPFPDDSSLADLDKSVEACFDLAKILNMPFVSGKDSLSSTYRFPNGKTLKIPPVLLISVFGKIPDVTKTQSSDFKKVGTTLVLVGNIDSQNLGGSSYFEVANGTGDVPRVDVNNLLDVLSSITYGIQSGKIFAAHDISEGGLGATVAEMSFGGGFGATLDLSGIKNLKRPDLVFFSETAGTFLVEVENEKSANILFSKVPHTILGKTQKSNYIEIKNGPKILAKANISSLKESWQKPMKEIFHG